VIQVKIELKLNGNSIDDDKVVNLVSLSFEKCSPKIREMILLVMIGSVQSVITPPDSEVWLSNLGESKVNKAKIKKDFFWSFVLVSSASYSLS